MLEEFQRTRLQAVAASTRMALRTANTHIRISLYHPRAIIKYNKRFKQTRDRDDDVIDVVKFISVKGVKAIGNRLSPLPVTEVLLEAPNAEKEEATALERQSELADQISEAPDSTSEADSAADVEVEEDSAAESTEAQSQEAQSPEAKSPSVETQEGDKSPQNDLPDPPVSDDGQASLF